MYAVEVRDHIMIAHSLPAEVFGPAQGMHGATFVVDAAFFTEDLDAHGLVVDITTEFLCGHIFEALAQAARDGRLGDGGRVKRIRVTLHESHAARGWFEGVI